MVIVNQVEEVQTSKRLIVIKKLSTWMYFDVVTMWYVKLVKTNIRDTKTITLRCLINGEGMLLILWFFSDPLGEKKQNSFIYCFG